MLLKGIQLAESVIAILLLLNATCWHIPDSLFMFQLLNLHITIFSFYSFRAARLVCEFDDQVCVATKALVVLAGIFFVTFYSVHVKHFPSICMFYPLCLIIIQADGVARCTAGHKADAARLSLSTFVP